MMKNKKMAVLMLMKDIHVNNIRKIEDSILKLMNYLIELLNLNK